MRALPLLALALSGCTSIRLPAAEQASLDPIAFFAGTSHGSGTLKVIASSTAPIAVESVGRPEPNGLLLRQTIHEGDKPPRVREWRIRRLAPNRYTGTLTEADGPVSLTTRGPRALIRYRMKNGMTVQQQLALQADERTILNHLEVRKWGVRVARLEETIRKAD
jgi:hypothetical protein